MAHFNGSLFLFPFVVDLFHLSESSSGDDVLIPCWSEREGRLTVPIQTNNQQAVNSVLMMTLSHYTCGPNILPLYEMSRIKTYHIQIIQHYKFWKRLIEEVLKTLYKFYVLNINFSLGKYSKRKYEGSDIGPTQWENRKR